MSRQDGFTFIEAVVVIVLLCLFAVIAAPRFLSIQEDEKIAALQGVAGAIYGASGVVYSESISQSLAQKKSASIRRSGQQIELRYGYPRATKASLSSLLQDMGLDDSFYFIQSYLVDDRQAISIGIQGYTEQCIQYVEPAGLGKTVFVELIASNKCLPISNLSE